MSEEKQRSGKEIRGTVSRVASRLGPCPRCGREHSCLPDDRPEGGERGGLEDGDLAVAEYEDGTVEVVEYRDTRQCMLGSRAGEQGPGFVSTNVNLPVEPVRWIRLPERLRTGAGEERERDLLWCQALTQTLDPAEMHKVLSYFNEHRPDHPDPSIRSEGESAPGSDTGESDSGSDAREELPPGQTAADPAPTESEDPSNETLADWLDNIAAYVVSSLNDQYMLREAARRLRGRGEVSSAEREAMQADVAELCRALGLGDHARPVSCHRVLQDEILPEIRRLRDDAFVHTIEKDGRNVTLMECGRCQDRVQVTGRHRIWVCSCGFTGFYPANLSETQRLTDQETAK